MRQNNKRVYLRVDNALGNFCLLRQPSTCLLYPSQEAGLLGWPLRAPLLPAGDWSLGQGENEGSGVFTSLVPSLPGLPTQL